MSDNDLRHPAAPLIALDAALARINQVIAPLEHSEICKSIAALGRVAAADILSPHEQPAFANSAVDGYAFRLSDAQQQANPILHIAGQSLAGQPFLQALPAGCAVRIATGGRVPDEADTIVMQEYCAETPDTVTIKALPELGACIRRAGSDFRKGDLLIPKGKQLTPPDIALLGALGIGEITVLQPIKIAIFSTGEELRTAGSDLQTGQIADTNGLMLQQLLRNFAVTTDVLPALPDEYAATATALSGAAKHYDLVITSGGVSVGSHDFIREALHQLGQIHFWRLAIRPGKPVLLGQIDRTLYVCLPGNPVSAMVTFFLIAAPLLHRLYGGTASLPPAFTVPLGQTMKKDAHLRTFSRARLELRDGVWKAVAYRDQSSHLIGSLAGTDGVLDLPIGASVFAENDEVLFRPFNGLYG